MNNNEDGILPGKAKPSDHAYPMTISPTIVLRQLYESVTDFAILTTDLQSRITSWNSGARVMFGYESSEVLGTSTAITFTDADIKSGQPFLEMHMACQDQKAADFRWHKRRDGSLFWADGVLTAIREEDGEVWGFLKIVRDITDRKLAQDEIARLASFDKLTGLYNRASFDNRRSELAASAFRNNNKLLLFMIDLDRFKEVNDTYGHQAGDQLLSDAASRLRSISRESDIVARIGGDEFALLSLNPSSTIQGAALASKMLHALSLPFHVGGREVYVSASIGIAVLPDDAVTPDALLKCADLALYEAKAQGRNCYHYFTKSLDILAHRRNLDQAELKRLERIKGFQVVYQPIIDTIGSKTVAMEALLRVPGPLLSEASRDYIIELAKEIGLLPDIGVWMFEQACSQLQQWRVAGYDSIVVAVNTCAQELIEENYLNRLSRILEQFGLEPCHIELELTERDAIELERTTSNILERLSALGFSLVLDDFGTGYSSLSYLRALPVSGLKLDRSFLKGVPEESDASSIARAIITLARDLRLNVTAEGVELPAQMHFLTEVGCTTFQGYLLAAPMAPADASVWLESERVRRSGDAPSQ